ncbi:MAG TPA: shikimate dehydrogenase [Solirubrobacterales bacterium]|nr:shikimate dehydrogenase [Solirubrobacterales bacterium]
MNRLAVIGQPIAHSRSPAMHTAAFEALGIADDWSYGAIEASPEEFARRTRELAAEGYVGANVTVPHKRAALEIADRASDVAREIGAANTLSFDSGEIAAENTDGTGLLAALPSAPAGMRALVLGAGGAARAAVWALRREGAAVEVWNRTPMRAHELAKSLGGEATEAVSTPNYDLIVNATSVGMHETTPSGGVSGLKPLPVDADGLHDRQVVVDLVYGSDETALVRAARERGAAVIDGLEVLVHQGAESLRIWTGLTPPLEAMRRAVRQDT